MSRALDADGGTPSTKECEACGVEKPAEDVETTTVDTLDPLEAEVCQDCQRVQNHDVDEGECLGCGAEVSPGNYVEIEYPLGPTNLPARLAGALCDDCVGAPVRSILETPDEVVDLSEVTGGAARDEATENGGQADE